MTDDTLKSKLAHVVSNAQDFGFGYAEHRDTLMCTPAQLLALVEAVAHDGERRVLERTIDPAVGLKHAIDEGDRYIELDERKAALRAAWWWHEGRYHGAWNERRPMNNGPWDIDVWGEIVTYTLAPDGIVEAEGVAVARVVEKP